MSKLSTLKIIAHELNLLSFLSLIDKEPVVETKIKLLFSLK